MIVDPAYRAFAEHAVPTAIELRRMGNTTWIALSGPFSKPGTSRFNNAMVRAVQSNHRFVVDLRQCTACDFPVLKLLARYKGWLDDRLQIVVAETGQTRRTIEHFGYARVLGITTSADLATELLNDAP
jgi:hypothetical protein